MQDNMPENVVNNQNKVDDNYIMGCYRGSDGSVYAETTYVNNAVNINNQVAETPQMATIQPLPIVEEGVEVATIQPISEPILNENTDTEIVYSEPLVVEERADAIEEAINYMEPPREFVEMQEEANQEKRDDLNIYNIIDINQNILIDNPVTEKDESLERPNAPVMEDVSIDNPYSNVNSGATSIYDSPNNVVGAYEEEFKIPDTDEEII